MSKIIKVFITLGVTAAAVVLTLVLIQQQPRLCDECGDEITGTIHYIELDVEGFTESAYLCDNCYDLTMGFLDLASVFGMSADQYIKVDKVVNDSLFKYILAAAEALVGLGVCIAFGLMNEKKSVQVAPAGYPEAEPQSFGAPDPYAAPQNYGTSNPYSAPQNYGTPAPSAVPQNYAAPAPAPAPAPELKSSMRTSRRPERYPASTGTQSVTGDSEVAKNRFHSADNL